MSRQDTDAEAEQLEVAPRRRKPPRRKGEYETSVISLLATFPPELAAHPIAAGCLKLARDVDDGLVLGKDVPSAVREIRLSLDRLEELRPAGKKDDATDTARSRREGRLLLIRGSGGGGPE